MLWGTLSKTGGGGNERRGRNRRLPPRISNLPTVLPPPCDRLPSDVGSTAHSLVVKLRQIRLPFVLTLVTAFHRDDLTLKPLSYVHTVPHLVKSDGFAVECSGMASVIMSSPRIASRPGLSVASSDLPLLSGVLRTLAYGALVIRQ